MAFPTGTTYGETAEYNCDAGYDINGFATRTCQADGTWSNNEPTCIIKGNNTLFSEFTRQLMLQQLNSFQQKIFDDELHI